MDDNNPFGLPSPFGSFPPGAFPPGMDISKLLTGSSGPVNWDVALFLAQAMAGDADARPRWTEVEDDYTELVRAAEVQVTEYTSLSSPTLLTPVQVVSRAQWARDHVKAFAPLVEPLATAMATAQSGDLPPEAAPFANLMQALAPMMAGAQTGMLVGFLSHHVLGDYDLQLPPPAGSCIVFVAPNLEDAERSLNVVPRDFRYWLALREVVRAVEYAQPGVRDEVVALTAEVMATVEIDPERLAGLSSIDPSDPSAMQDMFQDPAALLAGVTSPAQQEKIEALEALTGLIEGYAAHVLAAVGTDRIGGIAEIEAAITRREADSGDVDAQFTEMLGIGLRRSGDVPGRAFCDAVVASEGIAALNRVWDGPELRPTRAELDAPSEWIARVIGRRG